MKQLINPSIREIGIEYETGRTGIITFEYEDKYYSIDFYKEDIEGFFKVHTHENVMYTSFKKGMNHIWLCSLSNDQYALLFIDNLGGEETIQVIMGSPLLDVIIEGMRNSDEGGNTLYYRGEWKLIHEPIFMGCRLECDVTEIYRPDKIHESGGPYEEFENEFEEGWTDNPKCPTLLIREHHLKVANVLANILLKQGWVYANDGKSGLAEAKLQDVKDWQDIIYNGYAQIAKILYPEDRIYYGNETEAYFRDKENIRY